MLLLLLISPLSSKTLIIGTFMAEVVVILEVEGRITLDKLGMTIIIPKIIMDMVVLMLVCLGVALTLVLTSLVLLGLEMPKQTPRI